MWLCCAGGRVKLTRARVTRIAARAGGVEGLHARREEAFHATSHAHCLDGFATVGPKGLEWRSASRGAFCFDARIDASTVPVGTTYVFDVHQTDLQMI
jgi:hypothetical protein